MRWSLGQILGYDDCYDSESVPTTVTVPFGVSFAQMPSIREYVICTSACSCGLSVLGSSSLEQACGVVMPGAIKREASARDTEDIPSGLARHCDRIRVVAVVFARYAIVGDPSVDIYK